MKTFAERLRAARQDAGFVSAAKFAFHIGVRPGTYRYWERGQAYPDLHTLAKICRALGCSPNDLLPLEMTMSEAA